MAASVWEQRKNLEVSNMLSRTKEKLQLHRDSSNKTCAGTLQGEVELTILISDRLCCAKAAQQPQLSRLIAETDSKQERNALILQLAGEQPLTPSSAEEDRS